MNKQTNTTIKEHQMPLVKNRSTVNLAFQQKLPLRMQRNNVPAVGIAVIENGEVKDLQVFGELPKRIPAPLNTIFEVASLTKPIVAMMTLKLVDDGLWDLDEPLARDWIDPDLIDDPRHQQLTTRLVLSHQTGFPNWRRFNPTNKLAFEFDPGTKYQYSGEGFEYLKNALERRFDKPLE
jgi:CubicO group peptidase (beta-lactamase class C family)